jgi:hypothetical protein
MNQTAEGPPLSSHPDTPNKRQCHPIPVQIKKRRQSLSPLQNVASHYLNGDTNKENLTKRTTLYVRTCQRCMELRGDVCDMHVLTVKYTDHCDDVEEPMQVALGPIRQEALIDRTVDQGSLGLVLNQCRSCLPSEISSFVSCSDTFKRSRASSSALFSFPRAVILPRFKFRPLALLLLEGRRKYLRHSTTVREGIEGLICRLRTMGSGFDTAMPLRICWLTHTSSRSSSSDLAQTYEAACRWVYNPLSM